MASDQVPDILSFGQGYVFGSKINQARANKKNQQMLGGLRRRALGLGGESKEDQNLAARQILAFSPEEATKLFDGYKKLDTPAQRELRINNIKIARTGAMLQGVEEKDLSGAIMGAMNDAKAKGDQELLDGLSDLYQSSLVDPKSTLAEINALVSQSRDVEKIIASNEQREKNAAEALIKKNDSIFDKTDKIRARVNDSSKEFYQRRDAMTGLRASIQGAINGNNASQIAAIFQFMKALDPRSVVRESEFELVAEKTASIPKRYWNMWLKAKEGQIINPEEIRKMAQEAESSFAAHQRSHQNSLAVYKRQADSAGLDWSMIYDPRSGQAIDAPTPTPDAYDEFNFLIKTANNQKEKNKVKNRFKEIYGFVPKYVSPPKKGDK